MRAHVALLLQPAHAMRLWSAALVSQGCSVHQAADLGALREELTRRRLDAAIVDATALRHAWIDPIAFLRDARQWRPRLMLFLRLPQRVAIDAAEGEAVGSWPVAGLLPGTSRAAWRETLLAPLEGVMRSLHERSVDVAALETHLNVFGVGEVADDSVGEHWARVRQAARSGLDLATFRDRFTRAARLVSLDLTWRGRTYRECFDAADVVRLLAERWGMAAREVIAQARLLQGAGALHHVAREQAFDDAHLYFRMAGEGDRMARLDPAALARDMRGPRGVDIRTHRYHGKPYPRCMLGKDAVDWLRATTGAGVGEAEALGQRMVDLGLLRHVVDDHPFMDAPLFYRFTADAV